MQQFIILIISLILFSSCSFNSINQDYNHLDIESIKIHKDSYIDLVNKYGEPKSTFFIHKKYDLTVRLKYENIGNYEVVYVSLVHINYRNFQQKLINTTIEREEADLVESRRYYYFNRYRLWYNVNINSKFQKTPGSYNYEYERLFHLYPDQWVVSELDIRPLKENNEDSLLKRVNPFMLIFSFLGFVLI